MSFHSLEKQTCIHGSLYYNIFHPCSLLKKAVLCACFCAFCCSHAEKIKIMQFTQFHTRTFTNTRMCDDKIMNYDVLPLVKLAYTTHYASILLNFVSL